MKSGSPSRQKTSQTNFGVDILFKIFILLPFNEIFKIKCVCKDWATLLSGTVFMNSWIRLNGYPSFSWLVYHSHKKMKFRISFPKSVTSKFKSSGNQHRLSFKFFNPNPNQQNKKIELLASSKGLVLCRALPEYYVCNPLTQRWVSLPQTPDGHTNNTLAAFTCTCESISSDTCYMVVLMPPVSYNRSRKIKIQVFSSVVGEWNVYQVSHPKPRGYFSDFDSLVVINGHLYWIDGKDILSCNLNNSNSIQTSGQQCRLINFPVSVSNDDKRNNFCLKEYQDSLCFVAILTYPKHLSVWELKEDWELLHKDIDLLEFAANLFGRCNMDEYEAISGDESQSNYFDKESGAIEDVEVIGFCPVDRNIVLFRYNDEMWAYDMENATSEELNEPSFMTTRKSIGTRYCVQNSFPIKIMPTMLPSRSWKSTPVIMDQQGPRQS